VRAEHERGASGRFAPGLPRISDGQLLFLLHMLAHDKEPKEGGSRIAIIMNGSPLFTGDAGSGESEIRRFILEHDLLEALIALPEQLFYNTGIATYVWVVTNRKAPARKRKVQLIDASHFNQEAKLGLTAPIAGMSIQDADKTSHRRATDRLGSLWAEGITEFFRPAQRRLPAVCPPRPWHRYPGAGGSLSRHPA
jgi:type I restriction-modification system DNA methylase subunit